VQVTELISGGRRLYGMTFEPSEPSEPSEPTEPSEPVASAPGLLFVHGLSSDQVGYWQRAEASSERLRTVCLTFDLSGHGSSEGDVYELSPEDHLDDVVTAYDALAAHPAVDGDRVGVCGSSYGAYLAALLPARRPVSRLLLRAPALYDDRDLTTPLGRRRRTPTDGAAPRLFEALAGVAAGVLVVESGADEVIPRWVIHQYLRNCQRARHTAIDGAAHALAPEFEQAFLDILIGWFARL